MFRRHPVSCRAVPALVCGLGLATTSSAASEDKPPPLPTAFPVLLQNKAGELIDSRKALAGKHVLLYFRYLSALLDAVFLNRAVSPKLWSALSTSLTKCGLISPFIIVRSHEYHTV